MSILLARHLVLAAVAGTLLGCRPRGQDAAPADPARYVERACRDAEPGRMPGAGAPAPRTGYTPVAARDSLLRQIDAAEQRWRAGRPDAYSMTLVASCFCRGRGQPVILDVRGDSVVAVRDTTNSLLALDDWRAALHVAGLYREARQLGCDSTRTTRVLFDTTLGYPIVLSSESRLEVSDSEREYRVRRLEERGR